MNKKPSISERINARLREPEGQIFKDGKWRFWFLFLAGLGIVNALLTAMVFAGSVGGIAVAVGGLVGWVLVGTLYYSDSEDVRLARGVSLLDSATLCFVIAHFCFLMWVYGHLLTLQKADAKYDAAMEVFNVKAERIQADNTKIAASAEKIAEATVKAEKLKNDTAYQQRKTAEAGGRISASRAQFGGVAPSLSTSQVEIVKPEQPKDSATAFLTRWDVLIRVANFGELILAAITLIYIRNRSAAFNAKNAPTAFYGAAMAIPATVAALRRGDAKVATPVATVAEGQKSAVSALDALREHLRVIAFGIPKHWFKADPIVGGVTIRLCRRRMGRELTVKQTRQSDKILAAVNRPDFRERLKAELIACGFPIEGGE